MNTFPVLETERLLLREYTPQDAESLFELRTDERVKKNLFDTKEETLEKTKEILQRMEDTFKNGTGINWAIELKENTRLIGYIGFWKIVQDHDQAEIGYMLSPDHWGRGYMQEAISMVMDFGIQDLDLHRVEAYTRDVNEVSIHLLRKFGFVQEGHFRDYIKGPKAYQDALVFARIIEVGEG